MTNSDRYGAGCATTLGAIILAVSMGAMLGAPYGWAVLGTFLLAVGAVGLWIHRDD